MRYKITELLKSFSGEDVKNFRRFLHSPYFNESQKLIKLYETLIQHYPSFDSKYLTEEYISTKLNPNLPFKISTIKVLLFDLAHKAEEYFTILNFQGKHAKKQDFLRDEMFSRKLYKYIEQNIDKNSQMLDIEEDIDTSYFINRFYLITDIINTNVVTKPRSNSNFISSNARLLTERGKYVTYFFIKEILRIYDNLLTYKRTFNIDDEKNFVMKIFSRVDFEELLKMIISDTDNKKYSRVFEMNLILLRLFSKNSRESDYNKYKSLIMKYIRHLSQDEIRTHFTILMKYCMEKKAEKRFAVKYEKELFQIYKYVLSRGYYKSSVSDLMPIELYRTILARSLEMKKYKWTLEFIKKYCPKLHPDRRDNMYDYSIAKYYFHKGKFDSAMRNFHKIQLNHFMLKVDLKNMMLMTYYELGLYENALSLIETYRRFLSNTKILSVGEKKRCRNFFSIVHKMIQYKYSFNASYKYLVKKGLMNEMLNREWIEEKFGELDNRYVRSA